MKLAICSSNGSHVDRHFGKTEALYIYNIENNVPVFLEKREVHIYSPSEKFLKETGENHPFDPEKLGELYDAVNDCDIIYTVDIGEAPAQKLMEKGIKIKLCSCPVSMIPTCSGKCKPKT